VLNFFCAGFSLAACMLVLISSDWEEDVAMMILEFRGYVVDL
jgi:hypothetical protein